MEDLSFSHKEMAAVIKVAKMMAAADGKLHEAEAAMIAKEAMRFGIARGAMEALLEQSDALDATEALTIISNFNNAEKRYVSAYLGTMMAVDGNIDDKEVELWQFVSLICGLPSMNVHDAISYMSN